jgi:hypothetical protein
MSAWDDIRERGGGDQVRKEDIAVFYYDNDSAKKPLETIEEKDYKGYHYMILTFGCYPILDIRVKSQISIFSGYNLVILKFDDGSRYELDRFFLNGNETKFLYEFNKDGDYVNNNSYKRCTDEGHKYTVREIESYAEKFIDKIIECEDDKFKHPD